MRKYLSIIFSVVLGLICSYGNAAIGSNITWDENGIYFTTPSNAANTIIINNESFGSTIVDSVNDERRWPVFVLAVPPGYYDVELKASTNDFATLLYYTSTTGITSRWDSAAGESFTTDVGREVFYRDDIQCGNMSETQPKNNRSWIRCNKIWSIWMDMVVRNGTTNTTQISKDLMDDEKIRYIMVCPNFETAEHNPSEWMYADNENLTWIYLAFSRTDYEKGPSTTKTVYKWNICNPVQWRTKKYCPTAQRERTEWGDVGLYEPLVLSADDVVKIITGEPISR